MLHVALRPRVRSLRLRRARPRARSGLPVGTGREAACARFAVPLAGRALQAAACPGRRRAEDARRGRARRLGARGSLPRARRDGSHAPVGAFEQLLADGVAQRAGLAVDSESLHCTARELGRFLLARTKPPPLTLSSSWRRAAERSAPISARSGTRARSRPASDEEIFARWRPEIESLVQRSLTGGAVAAGLWFGRDAGRAVLATVTTQRRVIIAPFAPVVAGDRLAFSGEVLGNTEQISANVNQGALGFAECELDPNVALPRFTLSCPIASGDTQALLEVDLREPGRLLAYGALRVLARRADEPAQTWRRRSLGPPKTVATPEEFAQALTAALGRVRSGMELPALGLSLKQSEAANELVPHVMAESLGEGSAAFADIAAMGLLAGWEVGGAIKDASFASGMSSGGLDAERWLETALARPSGRASLLDPAARVLAVGALVSDDPPISAAIAVTYQLFGEENFQADAERVFARVAELRAARGRSAPAQLASARGAVEDVARSLPSGRLEPRAALDAALAGAASASGQALQGWVIEASQLEELRLPDELVDSESVRLAVAVNYYQPTDDPWGHYVALIIATAPGRDI